jgi:DNA-binding HxlR family transcriptional regulator
MKSILHKLHKAFESRIRLGIMSALVVNDTLDFNALKDYLEVTDGNLASHMKALEKEGFVGVKKAFIGKKPNTKYYITPEGKRAFQDHLEALQALIDLKE